MIEPSSFAAMAGTSPERLAAALEGLPHPVLVATREPSGSEEIVMNDAARRALALAPGDRVRSIADLHAMLRPSVDGDDLPESRAPLARALGGEVVTGEEVRVALPSTSRIWSIDASPIREGERLVGAVAICRDVTESALDEDMADDLLGRAAHDLRTPLTALKASAQLVSRGWERLDAAARARTLGLLLGQVDKLAARVDEVLDAARIRRGRWDLAPEDLDVSTTLRDIARELEGTAAAPRCTLEVPEGLHAHADRMRLRQVIGQLVLDAAERTGPNAPIGMRAQRNARGVEIVLELPPEPTRQTSPALRRRETARRLAVAVLARLGGTAAVEDGARRVVLHLAAPTP